MAEHLWIMISYVIITFSTRCAATQVGYEFFRYHEATFQCEHGVAAADLAEVEWKINGIRCAHLQIGAGNTVIIKYYCGLENRANMTSSNFTIYSLEPYDDGEFRCIAQDINFNEVRGATFNMTVKVTPENHTLSIGGASSSSSSSCDTEVTISAAQSTTILRCSVDSKPPANITWSTVPDSDKSWQNVTTCQESSDKISHCTNTLTIPKEDVPAIGTRVVTCHVHVNNHTSDRCIKLDRTDAGGSANQLGSWSVVYLVCWALVLLH